MKIKIKYFGLIASSVKMEEEELDLSANYNIRDLKIKLIKRYPTLSNLSFQIAKNHTISDPSEMIYADDEIALLPPFAGG